MEIPKILDNVNVLLLKYSIFIGIITIRFRSNDSKVRTCLYNVINSTF